MSQPISRKWTTEEVDALHRKWQKDNPREPDPDAEWAGWMYIESFFEAFIEPPLRVIFAIVYLLPWIVMTIIGGAVLAAGGWMLSLPTMVFLSPDFWEGATRDVPTFVGTVFGTIAGLFIGIKVFGVLSSIVNK